MGLRFLWVVIIFSLSKFLMMAQTNILNNSVLKSDAPVLFNPHSSVKVIENKRIIWVNNMIDSINIISDSEEIEISIPTITDIQDSKMISYRIYQKGKIVFPDGKFIVLVLHSAHGDPEIGDVALAVQKDGFVYINFGHVCGEMVHFVNYSTEIPVSAIDFFKSFISDTDDEKWKKWK